MKRSQAGRAGVDLIQDQHLGERKFTDLRMEYASQYLTRTTYHLDMPSAAM
jgi:hypothetical protein